MAEIITSAEGLDALPARSRIATDGMDDVLTKGHDGQWRGGPYDLGGRVWVGEPDDAEGYLPVTVLYRPDATTAPQPPADEREAYREGYEAWRESGQAMHAALLTIWRTLGPDREYGTFQAPQAVVDDFLAARGDAAPTVSEWAVSVAGEIVTRRHRGSKIRTEAGARQAVAQDWAPGVARAVRREVTAWQEVSR